MNDSTVKLEIMAHEGLVAIRFGKEETFLTWMDCLEMATRLVAASHVAAMDIDVDPRIILKKQVEFFEKVKHGGDDD